MKLIPLLILITGCAFGPVDPDPNAVENPIAPALIRLPIVVETISVNGHHLPAPALAASIATVRRHVKGPIEIRAGADLTTGTDTDGFITDASLNLLVASRTIFGPSSVVIISIPKMDKFTRGFAARLGDGSHLIVLYGAVIGGDRTWEIVLTHEFGHALGIPWKKTHKWASNHCTYPTCVMYPRADFRSVWSAIVHLGLYDDYCRICTLELQEARQ